MSTHPSPMLHWFETTLQPTLTPVVPPALLSIDCWPTRQLMPNWWWWWWARPVVRVGVHADPVAPHWFVASVGQRQPLNLSYAAAQIKASAGQGFKLLEVWLPQWELDNSTATGLSAATTRVLRMVFTNSPDAQLILRLLVEHRMAPITMQSITNASQELNVTSVSQGVSTVAGAWAEGAAPRVVAFVKALDREHPGHIAGVHLTAMHSGEWNWPGACTWDDGGPSYYSDYSEPMRESFCQHTADLSKDRGLNDSEASATANTPCTIPTAQARNTPRTGNAFVCGPGPPAPEADTIVQMNRFQSEVIATAVGVLSTALKQASGGHLLVLAFFGYTYTIADSRMIDFGHLRSASLLAHPDIDGFVSPYPYFATSRDFKGAMWPGGQANSPWLRKKLWIIEDDTRTALGSADPFRFCDTLESTLYMLRRNVFTSALGSYGLYWFDLENKGWFGDPNRPNETLAIWSAMRKAVDAVGRMTLPPQSHSLRTKHKRSAAEKVAPHHARTTQVPAESPANNNAVDAAPTLPPPQVAVFFDEDSPLTEVLDGGGVMVNMNGSETLLPSPGGSWVLLNASQELAHIGAPVRHYYTSDLARMDTKHIRLAVFLNAFAPSASLRKTVVSSFAPEATVLFIGPAGLVNVNATDGGCSTDPGLVATMVGIEGLVPGGAAPAPAVSTLDRDFTKATQASFPGILSLRGLQFGNPIPFSPLFYWSKDARVDDAAVASARAGAGAGAGAIVTVLARYTHSGNPSLVAAHQAGRWVSPSSSTML